jgi:hypothetical protein
MKTLDLNELSVSSFETGSAAAISQPYEPIRITTTNDPTAATFCYICPQETYNSCDFACPQEPFTIKTAA